MNCLVTDRVFQYTDGCYRSLVGLHRRILNVKNWTSAAKPSNSSFLDDQNFPGIKIPMSQKIYRGLGGYTLSKCRSDLTSLSNLSSISCCCSSLRPTEVSSIRMIDNSLCQNAILGSSQGRPSLIFLTFTRCKSRDDKGVNLIHPDIL